MSRTFVHEPWHVKQRSVHWRQYFTERHHHPHGVCDLAEYFAAEHWVRTTCRIEIVWRGRQVFCGCDMCSGYIKGKRRLHQATRARWRRDVSNALKINNWDEFDPTPAPRRSDW